MTLGLTVSDDFFLMSFEYFVDLGCEHHLFFGLTLYSKVPLDHFS